MKLKNKMLSMLILPLGILLNQPIEPDNSIKTPLIWENPSPTEVVKKYAEVYEIDVDLLYSVLICESNLNPKVKPGDNGHSKSIAQIKDPTWDYLEEKLGHTLDKDSYHDAIRLTAFAFSIDEGKNWTPWRAIKNGGSYTFTNVHTGKTQTVYCPLREIPK